jgi:LacI family transcriptional regulator
MVTITDVARDAGCSITTVSIVLNDRPLARTIAERTKRRVKETARRLGYHPNIFARSLAIKRSYTVGVMVPDITDPYCTQIFTGIENALYDSGYLPILTDFQNNELRFQRSVNMLTERRVEGLIAIANSLSLRSDLLNVFPARNIPTVIIGREREQKSMSSVVIDNVSGTRSGMRHLYELGHRKIAFIKGPRKVIDTSKRWHGIREFAHEVNLRINSKLVVELPGTYSSHEAGYAATLDLLRRNCPFTALMAFDDMTAFGAIRALIREGKRVPADCSVLGFDDVATAASYNPSLTTIQQPLGSLGSIGIAALLKGVSASVRKETFRPVHHKIQPVLIVRESTAAVRSAPAG